jgi:capsular exopolysaccharide synthesis family protein
MSYIFEALQRAEAERSGAGDPKNAESVADLLRNVEREIARKQPGGESALIEPGTVEPVAVESTVGESMPVESMPVESNPPLSRRVESVAELLHEAQQDFARQPSVNASAGREAATGVALAAVPMDVPEPQIAAKTSVPELPQLPAADATDDIFAEAKVLSPALKQDSRLVCLTDQGGLAAEKFRVLGLKLRNLREKRKLKRIVVTGTAPEEGKSLVAANLALNQSRSKVLKTLLIDGDLRRPTVASRFGFDGSLPGLSECLRGERSLSEVVYKLNGSGLFLLPAGRAPENPLDLMQGGRLPELLDRLGRFFDWIIIDTPPVIPVADTTYWMKQADGVLVVIREGVSEKKVVERALDSFDRALMLGIVVNSCRSTDHKDYYSRYSKGTGPTGEPASPAVQRR